MMANAENATATTRIMTMTRWIAVSALALLGACATSAPYGPATSDSSKGYSVQPIENNRFRIAYRDSSMEVFDGTSLKITAPKGSLAIIPP